MPRPKSWANLEIRTSHPVSDDSGSPGAFDAALSSALSQTPEGCVRQVAFVLSWIDGETFAGCIALERNRYDGLRAQLITLAVVQDASRRAPDQLIEQARSVRARASMAAVHELLAGTQARISQLVARGAARSRR